MFPKSARFEDEAARKAKAKSKEGQRSVKSPERPADAGNARGRAASSRMTAGSGKERVTSPTAATREALQKKGVKAKQQAFIEDAGANAHSKEQEVVQADKTPSKQGLSEAAARMSTLTFEDPAAFPASSPPGPLTSPTATGSSAAALRSARASTSATAGARLPRGAASIVQMPEAASTHDNPVYGRFFRSDSPEVQVAKAAGPSTALRRSVETWVTVSAEADNEILGRNPATNFVPDAGHTIAAHEAAVGDEGAAAGARGAGTRISKAKARAREPEIGDMKRAMAALYVKIRKAEGDLELQSIRRSSAVGAGEEEEEAAAKELEARASLLKDAVEKLLACDGGGEAAGTEIEGVGQSDVELAGEALGATAIKVTDDIEAGATSGGMIDTEAYTKLEKKLEQVQADLLKTRSDVDAVVADAQAATGAAVREMAAIKVAAAAEVAKAQKQAAAREKAAAAKQKEAAADVAAAKQETAEVKRAAAADMEYYEGERKKAREEGVARERQLEQAKASEAAIGVRLANALVTVRTLEQRLLRVEAERDAAVRRARIGGSRDYPA